MSLFYKLSKFNIYRSIVRNFSSILPLPIVSERATTIYNTFIARPGARDFERVWNEAEPID